MIHRLLTSFSRKNAAYRLIIHYILPIWPLLIIAFITNLLAAGSTASIPFLAKWTVDKGINNQENIAFLIGSSIAIIVVVRGILTYLGNVTLSYVSQRMGERLKIDFFSKLLYADLPFITSRHSGQFISNFAGDIQNLQNVILSSTLNFFQHIFTVIALMGVLLKINPKLAILGIITAPSATILSRVLRSAARKHAHKNMFGLASLTSLLSETLSGFRIVRAYGQEPYELQRFRTIARDMRRNGLRAAIINSVAGPFVDMLSGLGIALIVCFAGMEIRSGHTTVGQLTAFLASLPLAYQPLKNLLSQQAMFQEAVAASERVFQVLDQPCYFQDKPGAQPICLSQGHVSFRDVSFSYQETPYVLSQEKGRRSFAIENINLDIQKGKTIALVGPSGSGKSTILNLLMRFYLPYSGTICIDGQDIAEVTLETLRHAIALVTQEPFLFDDTIEANIAYGAAYNAVSFEKIVEAAKNADAHQFIIEQPLGYKTRVGQAGVHLSGGQKQRIAIARAMLKNAPILLLDEATSSLDTQSEFQVQRALTRLMEGRSTLVIAHRLSTIVHADEIYVLAKGHVVEKGTHDELIKNQDSLYAKLYMTQFKQDIKKIKNESLLTTTSSASIDVEST